MNTWLDRDQKSVWHPFSPLKGGFPMQFIKSAEGIYLHTEDGRKIIDGISSWWVNTLGHANQGIARALSDQASSLEHVIFAGFTHKPAIQLSEELLKILPKNQKKIFYSDNGSTAVEVALKMTIQYWRNKGVEKRNTLIALEDAYHGDTFGSMAVGGRGIFTEPFHPYLFDVKFIPFPDGRNDSEVIERLENYCKQGDVSGFIYEPLVQGASGMRIYSAETLDKLVAVAKKYDVLCIADEVFTGFYRTGKFLAGDFLKEFPDLICLSKGLTAGALPMSVTSVSERIVDEFRSTEFSKIFFHGHSFTGNPLGCAVALESLSQLNSTSIQNNLKFLCEKQSEFALRHSNHPQIKRINSLGTLLSIELNSGANSGYFSNLREHIYSFFMERGILMRPIGNVFYFLPPYIINEQEIDLVHSAIQEFLSSLEVP